jgi:hypothetical protein
MEQVNATELNKLTDEQVDKQVKELQAKSDTTVEEKEQLKEMKEERQTRYQRRLDKKHSEMLAESERANRLERELGEEKKKREELEEKVNKVTKPELVNEFVEIDGKKFYTDEALTAQVQAEELTPTQAYAHQQQRNKAEIKFEIRQETEQKGKKEEAQKIYNEDREKVVKEYPHFDPRNPSHNPEDPLYKLASEIWAEGYQANPRGLSLAINRAKQILRYSDEHPDVSEDLSVGKVRGTGQPRETEGREAQLTTDEKENAVRMYCLGGVMNPTTGKQYTEAEAIAKAIKAKNARMRR